MKFKSDFSSWIEISQQPIKSGLGLFSMLLETENKEAFSNTFLAPLHTTCTSCLSKAGQVIAALISLGVYATQDSIVFYLASGAGMKKFLVL